MKVWAVLLIRDEEDIIRYTISHLLNQGLDGIVVGFHQSNEATRWAVKHISDKIVTIEFNKPKYLQGKMTTKLAQEAGNRGADWILPIDADELWSNPNGTLAEFFQTYKFPVGVAQRWNYLPTEFDDISILNPYIRLCYHNIEPTFSAKIFYQYDSNLILGNGNYQLFKPNKNPIESVLSPLKIYHVPFRNKNQFRNKVIGFGKGVDKQISNDTSLDNWSYYCEKYTIYREWQKQGDILFERLWQEKLKTADKKYLILEPIPYIGIYVASDPDPVPNDPRPGMHIWGWMSPTEIEWLIKYAQQMHSVVEVGSLYGRSSYALLSACPGTVYCIDPWIDDYFQKFMTNCGHFTNLRAIQGLSPIAGEKVPDMIDMVFIDGDHDYESVKADIEYWTPRTRKLICGHDWKHLDCPGVEKAVMEYFSMIGKVVQPINGTGFWSVELNQ